MRLLNERALDIWHSVKALDGRDLDRSYDFKVGQVTRDKFLAITGVALPDENGMLLNRTIRKQVNDILLSPDTDQERAKDIYKWIVGDWGGMHRGSGTVRAWAETLHGDYGGEILQRFADEWKFRRIASRSKIMAFIAPDRHAIYDSRVAVTPNVALFKIGETSRFYMPPSRNKIISQARTLLGSEKQEYDYNAYIALCSRISELVGMPLLDIGASLFASAVRMSIALQGTSAVPERLGGSNFRSDSNPSPTSWL